MKTYHYIGIVLILCVLFLGDCADKQSKQFEKPLVDKLKAEIEIKNKKIQSLQTNIDSLKQQQQRVEIKYIKIREEVKTKSRPEMQDYFNEITETDNRSEFVNLDSVGSVNLANKLIDGQVAKAKLLYADTIIFKQQKQNVLLKSNISDLQALLDNSEQNILDLEKSLKKQKKRNFWTGLGTFAVGVGVGVLVIQ